MGDCRGPCGALRSVSMEWFPALVVFRFRPQRTSVNINFIVSRNRPFWFCCLNFHELFLFQTRGFDDKSICSSLLDSMFASGIGFLACHVTRVAQRVHKAQFSVLWSSCFRLHGYGAFTSEQQCSFSHS